MSKNFGYFTYENGKRNRIHPCDGFRTSQCTNESIAGHVIFLFQGHAKEDIMDMFHHEEDHLLSYQYLTPSGLLDYKNREWYQKGEFNEDKAASYRIKLKRKTKCSLSDSLLSRGIDYKQQLKTKYGSHNVNEVLLNIISLQETVLDIFLNLKNDIDDGKYGNLQEIYDFLDDTYGEVIDMIFLPIKGEIAKRIRKYYNKVKSVRILLNDIDQDNAIKYVSKMRGLSHLDLVGQVEMYKHNGSLVFGFKKKEDFLSVREGAKVTKERIVKNNNIGGSHKNENIASENKVVTLDKKASLLLEKSLIMGSREVTAYLKDGTSKERVAGLLFSRRGSYDYFSDLISCDQSMYYTLHRIYKKRMKDLIDYAYGMDDMGVANVSEMLASFPLNFWKRVFSIYKHYYELEKSNKHSIIRENDIIENDSSEEYIGGC